MNVVMHPINKLLFILLISGPPVFAQSPDYVAMLETFRTHYNEGDSEAVFNLMSTSMREKIGIKNIHQMMTSFNTYFGHLKSFEFIDNQDALENYIGHFIHGKQKVTFILDMEGKIGGLLFKPMDLQEPGKFIRNSTSMSLPFKGEWFTFWGGDNKRQNYHVINPSESGAFDFIILDKNDKSYRRSGTRNEDYYAFGQPLFAVCDAVVIEVITGIEDNRPGQMNPSQTTGNTIMLKTKNDEYIIYAHFRQGTIKVKEGQTVSKGQYLGDCGNSGNSSEPHLHLHIQDSPNRLAAKGAYCYFDRLMVNGKLEENYSPIKGDRISSPKE